VILPLGSEIGDHVGGVCRKPLIGSRLPRKLKHFHPLLTFRIPNMRASRSF
jgi:hypothetical protein